MTANENSYFLSFLPILNKLKLDKPITSNLYQLKFV